MLSNTDSESQNAKTGKQPEVWSNRYPVAKKGEDCVLKAEIFWTTRTDIHDHEALYEPLTNNLRHGIQKFREISYTIPASACKGWKIIRADNGEDVYELSACVVTQIKGGLIRFGFRMVPYGNASFDDEEKDVLWEDDDFSIIFDQKFSHVALEADPAGIVPSVVRAKSESLFVSDDDVVGGTENSVAVVRKSSADAAN